MNIIKSYCSNCNHFNHDPIGKCLAPQNIIGFEESWKESKPIYKQLCSEINKDNNCHWWTKFDVYN